MKEVFFIIAMVAALTACNNANNKSTSERADSVAVQSVETTHADLFGTEWKLSELSGEAIVLDTAFKQEPVLVFEKDTEKLTGNGGCNGFMGSYKLKEDNGIELSVTGATMMACPNLELEGQFHDALKQAKSYRIEGNTLLLDNEAKTAVARLEAKGQ